MLRYLMDGKLGAVQLAESLKYLKKVKEDGSVDAKDLEKTCGIGTGFFDFVNEFNLLFLSK